jgi:hypothetical protein
MPVVKPLSQTKPVTINPYVNTVVRPVSNTKSWSDDTITSPAPKVSRAKNDNTWDTSPSEDDVSVLKPKVPSILQKTQPFVPSTNYLTESDSENDSVETEIRRLDTKKPTAVANTVNKNTGTGYKVVGLSKVQSPLSDDSSWTTTPVPFNKETTKKVEKPKTDESTWDDSRPLSADIKKSVLSNSSPRKDKAGVENLTSIIDTIMHSDKKQ